MTEPDFATRDDTWWRERRAERLARDVVATDTCLFRPDQLLLSDAAAALVADELEQLNGRPDDGNEALAAVGLQHWRVPGREDLPEQALRLRAVAEARRDDREGESDLVVSLNHVLTGQPKWAGGPATHPVATKDSRPESRGSAGRPPDITVLDTGYDHSVRAVHPGMAAALRPDPSDVDALRAPGTTELLGEAGHGTFIIGLVLLMAPDLAVDPGRVLDPDGVCDDVQLCQELLEARHSSPVINMSLGGYTFDDAPPPGASRMIERLMPDRVIVAAAGNHGSTRPFWPAALKHVVAVAAIDDPAAPTPPAWTNRGPWVDVCTQGVDLVSTYVEGVYPTGPTTSEDFTRHAWARWSGTSFAAPLVAAELARRVVEGRAQGQPVSADQARRDLLASLSPVPGHPELGLLYEPPVDPRRP
ncbi:MAG: S8/S53 family peptidase [Candidatus Nanopelagicales bacterium]